MEVGLRETAMLSKVLHPTTGPWPRYAGLRMLQRRGGAAVVALCAVLAACGSSKPTPAKPSPVIARVGGNVITLAQFNIRYESAYTSIAQGGGSGGGPVAVTQLRAAILRGLISDTIIREEATKLGLESTPKEAAATVATDAQQTGGMSALET